MSESIGKRVSRLVSGGINAFVTKLESGNAEVVMNQSVVEVDELIAEVRKELGTKLAERTNVLSSVEAEKQRHIVIGKEIDVAIEANRDDLAEVGINRQLQIEAQLDVLGISESKLATKIMEMERFVRALQGRKAEYIERVKQFAEAQKSVASSTEGEGSQLLAQAEQIETNFSRLVAKVGATISPDTDPSTLEQLDELTALSKDNAVTSRLAQAKARLANPVQTEG